MNFTKMQGTGNDFIMIDHRDNRVKDRAGFARKMCPRGLAIGADGVLFVEKSSTCDIRMRIFNADGSEAEMCGNGARCFARFVHELGITKPHMSIETAAGAIYADITDGGARVQMTDAAMPKEYSPFSCDDMTYFTLWYINTGVPHVVIPIENLETLDIVPQGRAIRQHATFAPSGTNVNFITRRPDGTLAIRTYERGVEGETLACGTGNTAAALVANILWNLPSPICLHTRSGSMLTISFEKSADHFTQIYLEGPVVTVYEGTICLP